MMMTQLVALADEFDLTTVTALSICADLGIAADDSASDLGPEDVERFRSAARQLAFVAETEDAERGVPGQTVIERTDFRRVPEEWEKAAKAPPPPEPGSGPLEHLAVWAAVGSGLAIVVSLITGLCGAIFALFPLSLAVRAQKSIDAGGLKGHGLVLLARAGTVIAVIVALGVTWVAWSGNLHQLPTIRVLDVFVPGELRDATTLTVGDCILEPEPGITELQLVQVVPCGEGHDVEFIAQLERFVVTPLDDLDDYPGSLSIENVMFAECPALWEEFVGSELGASELDLYITFPTERAWQAGDRAMLCGVASLDGNELVGSMAGSGR
jgi:hypothetical protein